MCQHKNKQMVRIVLPMSNYYQFIYYYAIIMFWQGRFKEVVWIGLWMNDCCQFVCYVYGSLIGRLCIFGISSEEEIVAMETILVKRLPHQRFALDRSLPDNREENDRNGFMTNRDRGIEFLSPHECEESEEENQYHSD
ncbi:Bud site selection protein [Trichinella spiralis]|uniref:Bud site selection protein n=1 Tax=Trichinella spiralis TaxID=6334 RepID=A0ABR3KXE4_TRISP